MADKHRRRCLTPLAIGKRGLQITLSYHFLPTSLTRIKHFSLSSWGSGGEQPPPR